MEDNNIKYVLVLTWGYRILMIFPLAFFFLDMSVGIQWQDPRVNRIDNIFIRFTKEKFIRL